MAKHQLVEATLEHAAMMAANMKQADIDEVWATGYYTPLEALELSIKVSRDPLCWLANGEVVCVFGCAEQSLLTDKGVPWMLTTDEISKYGKLFLRYNKKYIDIMKDRYRELENHVDARNTDAIKWLRWLGFSFGPAEPFGVERLPFHRFYMKGNL